jgi:hypothetical protein
MYDFVFIHSHEQRKKKLFLLTFAIPKSTQIQIPTSSKKEDMCREMKEKKLFIAQMETKVSELKFI